ncbi:MAG: hypothetical protein ACI4V7_06315 [Succinivibrionaceae bacterium]
MAIICILLLDSDDVFAMHTKTFYRNNIKEKKSPHNAMYNLFISKSIKDSKIEKICLSLVDKGINNNIMFYFYEMPSNDLFYNLVSNNCHLKIDPNKFEESEIKMVPILIRDIDNHSFCSHPMNKIENSLCDTLYSDYALYMGERYPIRKEAPSNDIEFFLYSKNEYKDIYEKSESNTDIKINTKQEYLLRKKALLSKKIEMFRTDIIKRLENNEIPKLNIY